MEPNCARRLVSRACMALAMVGMCAARAFPQTTSVPSPKPIEVKAVVVAMFEVGEDTGDTPGEYQLWVEREHLDRVIELQAGFPQVGIKWDGGVGVSTG